MPSGLHIFVIDDERDFLDSLVALLTLEGFRVTGAQSGSDALQRLSDPATGKVDAFLIDFRMPGQNGGEALRQIRAKVSPGFAILVSAAADIARLAEEYEFDGWLRKPCDVDELLEAISRCTVRNRTD